MSEERKLEIIKALLALRGIIIPKEVSTEEELDFYLKEVYGKE